MDGTLDVVLKNWWFQGVGGRGGLQRWLHSRESPRYSINCQQPRLTGGIDGGADGPSSRWKAGGEDVAHELLQDIYVYVYVCM